MACDDLGFTAQLCRDDAVHVVLVVRSERWLGLGDRLLGRDRAAQLAQVASGSEALGPSALTAPG